MFNDCVISDSKKRENFHLHFDADPNVESEHFTTETESEIVIQ